MSEQGIADCEYEINGRATIVLPASGALSFRLRHAGTPSPRQFGLSHMSLHQVFPEFTRSRGMGGEEKSDQRFDFGKINQSCQCDTKS
jgi:hypothetical protein